MSELTRIEANRLEELESIIDTGMRTFRVVGEALAEVNDGRLYRASHKTFEAYCRDRWGMGKRHAYQHIAAAAVAREAAVAGVELDSESEARRIASVPEEHRPQVIAEVKRRIDAGETSAKVVASVVREVSTKTENCAQVAHKVSPTIETSAPTASLPRMPLANEAAQLASIRRQVKALVEQVAEVIEGTPLASGFSMSELRQCLRGFDGLMDDLIPTQVCPACEGEGCIHCDHVGVLTKTREAIIRRKLKTTDGTGEAIERLKAVLL